MRILIEEYQYEVAKMKDILHGTGVIEKVDGNWGNKDLLKRRKRR